jgi:hypothetical protein
MKKSFNQLSAMEKFALVWTAPVTLAVVIAISIVTLVVYLFKVVFVYSGTIGAAQYLFNDIQKKIKERQFKKIRREDKFQAEFDRAINEQIKRK